MDIKAQIPPALPLQKGGIPSLAKRGQGRFSQQYVFSIMDSLISKGQVTYSSFLFANPVLLVGLCGGVCRL